MSEYTRAKGGRRGVFLGEEVDLASGLTYRDLTGTCRGCWVSSRSVIGFNAQLFLRELGTPRCATDVSRCYSPQ